MKGHQYKALLDIAASHNFIHPRLASDVKDFKISRVELAGKDHTLKITGTTRESVKVTNITCDLECLVAEELREDLILGYPWFTENEVVLNVPRRCAHFGKEERGTVHWETPQRGRVCPKINFEPTLHNVPEEPAKLLQEVLQKFNEVFDADQAKTTTRTTSHHITLTNKTPAFQRPYKYSDKKKRVIADQVESMLADGIIEPSAAPWSSPIVLVSRKDREPRFCVDYRRLNMQTRDESTALPMIQEALKDIGSAKIFSTLDLKSGYWQIPLSEETKPLTTFTTPDGASYRFKVMPFGLKNAPATFQRMMTQEVLTGHLRKFCLVYLDDIIIFSENWEDHVRHLHLVLERLQEHNLTCSIEKCHLGQTALKYLGHIITQDGNQPQPEQLTQIRQATNPRSRKELRSFLGLCNWLREYIPKFAEIAAPLTDLLSGKTRFKWSPTQQAAMEKIQEAFEKPLELKRPIPDTPFVLQTDASGIGIAAVLYQQTETERRVISYASARLSPAETRYHINEQECLAVVWAIKRYRPYLEDKPFTVVTDSRALTWLQQTKDHRAKLTRWALLLQEFSFKVRHCAGRDNELADSLSRNPTDQPVGPGTDSWERMLPPEHKQPETRTEGTPVLNQIGGQNLIEKVVEDQQKDTDTQKIIQKWQDLEKQTEIKDPGFKAFHKHYRVNQGSLFRVDGDKLKIYVPTTTREHILHVYHDDPLAGHPGRDETLRSISDKFHWPDIQKEVTEHVAACLICASSKRAPPRGAAPMRPRPPKRPWDTISIDIMGPYPETRAGNRFIVVAQDIFTKWTEAKAIPKATTRGISQFLREDVFMRFGYPRALLTDNGKQFKGEVWEKLCKDWKVLAYTTPIYHPRANPVERRNQEIKKGLRIHLRGGEQRNWDRHIPAILFNLRTRKNAATGCTPGHALLGAELQRPGEWGYEDRTPEVRKPTAEERQKQIEENVLSYQKRYKDEDKQPRFQAGEQVMIRSQKQSNKKQGFGKSLAAKYLGPYAIRELYGGSVYLVDRDGVPTKYHQDLLRAAPPPKTQTPNETGVNTADQEDKPQRASEEPRQASRHRVRFRGTWKATRRTPPPGPSSREY